MQSVCFHKGPYEASFHMINYNKYRFHMHISYLHLLSLGLVYLIVESQNDYYSIGYNSKSKALHLFQCCIISSLSFNKALNIKDTYSLVLECVI